MSSLSFRRLGAACAILACLLLVTAAGQAKPCTTSGGGCRATVSISVYTPAPGEPVPFCLAGVPLYLVTVSMTCRVGDQATESEVVCSVLSNPVVVEAGGRTHYIAPDSGSNWADVVDDCGNLIHKVD